MSAAAWAGFVVAAAIGAPARYLVDGAVQDAIGGRFPWGTAVVNHTGSLLLGVLTGRGLYHAFPDELRFVLGTGFCGAYTTFSTFTFETVRLAEGGDPRAGGRNLAVNVLGGLAAAAAGLALAAI